MLNFSKTSKNSEFSSVPAGSRPKSLKTQRQPNLTAAREPLQPSLAI